MREKNTGAENAEKRGDCFHHDNNPKTQRQELTVQAVTQSKGFRSQPDFEIVMMIFCNTPLIVEIDVVERINLRRWVFPCGCAALMMRLQAKMNVASAEKGGGGGTT